MRTPQPSGRGERSPYLADLPYAPGLDGVRALAVTAVVLYHARVSWLPGGFLGVDVFFVLSGYLITSLLLARYRKTGRIDLTRFWIGRARRLLPAALLVIVVCLIVEALFFRGDLGVFRGDALASVLYVNNWHQIFAGQSYFAAFGRPSLLEHYWSLSVEEQFYVVWPLVLVGGLAISRERWIVGAAVAASFISVGLMALQYHGGVDASRVYYGTDTHAAPLMIGAVLACAWPFGRMTAQPGRGARTVLDGVGLVAIAALLLVAHHWQDYDPFLYHGGFLIAAGIAAAIIACAVHPACSLATVLGVRPLRWIGQRSYGIYLWHWPVMALTRPGIDVTWSSWLLVPMQIAITLALAALSFRFVEMPVRRGEAWRRIKAWLDRRRPSERLAAVAASAALAFGVIGATMLTPLAPARSPFASLASATATRTAIKQLSPSGGVGARLAGGSRARGSPKSAADPAPAAGRMHPSPVRTVGGGVQATIISDSVAETIDETPQALQALTQGLRLRLALEVCRRVILTSCTYQGQTPPPALQTIVSLGRRIGPLLIVDVGYNDDSDGYGSGIDKIMRAALAGGAREVIWLTLRDVGNYASTYQATNAAIRQAARRWPQLRIADWNAYSAGKPWFADDVHPNPTGAVALARYLRSYATGSQGP